MPHGGRAAAHRNAGKLDHLLDAWRHKRASAIDVLCHARALMRADQDGQYALSVFNKVRDGGIRPDRGLFEEGIVAAGRVGEPGFAMRLFDEMRELAVRYPSMAPTEKTYSDLMRAFGQRQHPNPAKVQAIFDAMRGAGLKSGSHAWTALVTAHVHAGDIDGACRKLDEMELRDPASCSVHQYATVMDGCTNQGDPARAREVFSRMENAGVAADSLALNQLVKAAAAHGDTVGALAIVDRMRERKLEPDRYTCKHLVNAFLKAGDANGALAHLRARPKAASPDRTDPVLYGAVMGALLDAGDPHTVLVVLQELRDAGIPLAGPVCSAASAALGWVGDAGRLDALVADMRAASVEWDLALFTTVMRAYDSAGHPARTIALYREMQDAGIESDARNLTVALGALSRLGAGAEAERLLRKAESAGMQPTAGMRGFVINAYVNGGQVDAAMRRLEALKASGPGLDEAAYAGLLNTLADAARPVEAIGVFREMQSIALALLDERRVGMVFKAFGKAGDPEGAEAWFRATLLPEARSLFLGWAELVRLFERAGRPRDAVRIMTDAIRAGAVHANAGFDGRFNQLDFHLGKVAVRPEPDDPERGVPTWVMRALLGYHRANGNITATTTYIVGKGGEGRIKAAVLSDLQTRGQVYREDPDNAGLLVPLRVPSPVPAKAPVDWWDARD